MKFVFVMVSVLCTGALISCTEQNTSPGKVDAAQLPAVQGQQGMKIYIDPATGKQSMPPVGRVPPAAFVSSPKAKVNTSSQGLIEQSAPGGGTMVDLQGRFQSSTKATVKKNGSIVIEHQPAVNSKPLPRGE